MTVPLSIAFASTNPGKLREMEAYTQAHRLPIVWQLPQGMDDVAETEPTFGGNARLKAQAALGRCQCDLILAEDSGFEVVALAGRHGLNPFPGVRSNRWMTEAIRSELLGLSEPFDTLPLTYEHINQGILAMMQGENNRAARYVSAICVLNGQGQVVFETEGWMRLQVVTGEPAGTHGFGYDPIVMPETTMSDQPLTLAQMDIETKNAISHRGMALSALAKWLTTWN